MSVMKFLLFSAIGTLLSWLTWVMVLLRVDPQNGGFVAQALFFVSLWMALVGTGTLLGFGARYIFEHEPIPFRQMAVAARQALTLSLAVVLMLGLQAGRALSIWTALLVVLLAIGVEAFFLAGQSRYRTDLNYGSQHSQ